ncbi:hypothetical protein KFK09_028756 [Dendrobium nobile]|uniref:GDP-L-galactose phosphorylase n=1 Tax=Dendrobium nobile TaxID=94219 RepID=A0A8T3A3Y6_DENNO|nr:hypothetical protein KFK09_028756 [Dendrobium nobile]
MSSNGANEERRDANEGNSKGREECDRDRLIECFLLHGGQLPLYTFSRSQEGPNLLSKEPHESFLNKLLQRWEEKNDRGLFHHDIAACESKILPGDYGFIVRLIEGRDIKKRPTEYRMNKVLQPFDEKKFNFTKISQAEVICRFEESDKNITNYVDAAPIFAHDSVNIIAINVSPIGYGHILLIPRIFERLPQRMDRDSLLLSLHLAREAASPNFKIGYNSLGAFATINHLHFQAFHLLMLLSAEKASTECIATLRGGVKILRLLNYPVKGFVYEGGTNLQDLAYTVCNTCTFLEVNNQPYNMLISDSGKRIFVFLQCFAERQALGKVSQEILDTQVNPAAWEISGYLVMKRRKDYEEASEQNICGFFEEVSLSDKFEELQESVVQALKDEWMCH